MKCAVCNLETEENNFGTPCCRFCQDFFFNAIMSSPTQCTLNGICYDKAQNAGYPLYSLCPKCRFDECIRVGIKMFKDTDTGPRI